MRSNVDAVVSDAIPVNRLHEGEKDVCVGDWMAEACG